MMNAETVRQLLQYNPETGEFFWNVSNRRGVSFGKKAGGVGHHGYYFIRLDGKLYTAHRLAWLHFYGAWPEMDVDHIDGNPSNNSISNLRLATMSQNIANSKRSTRNTSGIKGVSWARNERKWVAQITKQSRVIRLGYFASKSDAAQAYREAAVNLFGEFARPC
jgi:hypothetical protein